MKAVGVDVEEFGGEGKIPNLKKRFPLLGDEKKLEGWEFYYNPVSTKKKALLVSHSLKLTIENDRLPAGRIPVRL